METQKEAEDSQKKENRDNSRRIAGRAKPADVFPVMASRRQESCNRILSLICQGELKKMFDHFITSLNAIKVHNKNFNFSHNTYLNLTKGKFCELLEEHKIKKKKKRLEASKGILTPYVEEGGRRKKTIILHVKSKNKNPRYDVLEAELSSWTALNWRGIFLFVFSVFLVCAVLYVFVSPQLGQYAAAFFVLILVNNLVKQSEPVHVEEISTWFMIRQLIEAKCLIKQGGSLVFVHGRNHTTFDGLVNIAETEQTSPQYPAGNIFKTEPVGFT